jgi:hypothetical protein
MFTLGNGSQMNNAWNMPEGYSQRFLKMLKMFELDILTTTDSWIIVGPAKFGHPKYNKWFIVSDNGGEVMVGEINSSELRVRIPYTTVKAGTVNTATLAHRVSAAIRGESIDWSFSFSESEEATLLKP